MKYACLTLILFFTMFLSGCYNLIEKKENARIVNGWGIDLGFYPYPSIRLGKYDYIIIVEKGKTDD